MWYEWNSSLPSLKALIELRQALIDHVPKHWHWFFYEPWSPWVVRFLIEPAKLASLPKLMSKGTWREIDMTADKTAYGVYWDSALKLFESTSEIGLMMGIDRWTEGQTTDEDHRLFFPAKLVHCTLNAWALNTADEVSFHYEQMSRRQVIDMIEQIFGQEDIQALNRAAETFIASRSHFGLFNW